MTGYLKAILVTADTTIRALVSSGAPAEDRLLVEDQVLFIQLDARASAEAFMIYTPRGSAAPSTLDGTVAHFELMPGVEYKFVPREWGGSAFPIDLSRLYVKSSAVEAADVKIRVRCRAIDSGLFT